MKRLISLPVSAVLLLALLLVLGACGGGNADTDMAEPTVAADADMEATDEPEEEMTDTDVMTDTEMTDTEAMTGTEAMTDTMDMDSSDTMTDTEMMTDTEAMTDTMDMDSSDMMTGTETMTDTETMTGTTGMDSDTMVDTDTMTNTAAMTAASRGFAGAVGNSVPASTLLGYGIRNSAEERLGSLQDLIFDLQSGQIEFSVVEFGGFLGLGDTYYVVPPQDLEWIPEVDDADDGVLMIDITEEELENAPVFTYDTDLTADGWNADYGTYWDERSGRAMDEEMDSEMEAEMEDEMMMGFSGAMGAGMPATELIGRSVENSAEENLGSVEDLLVNVESGQIHYAIISFGGFLGIGENYYAVPLQDLSLLASAEDMDTRLQIDITEEELQDAPEFTYDDDLSVDGWNTDIDSYWESRRNG